MSVLTQVDILSIPDPALKMFFFVRLPFTRGDQHIVVENVSPTFQKVPAKPRFNGGSNNYFPDNNDIDGLSITFYETHNFAVTAWLTKWRQKVVHADGTYGLPDEYKHDIEISYYDYDKESIVMTATYKGCWPTDQQPFELVYEDPQGRLQAQAQFAVDTVIFS